MKIGFTNGCFDLLHDGHRYFLEECRKRCDHLIVAIDTDRSVRAVKGPGRPFNPLEIRIEGLQAICSAEVDAIVPFDGPDRLGMLIQAIAPQVLFKGDDYRGKTIIGQRDVERAGGAVLLIVRLPGLSTTEIAHATRRLS